MKANPTRGILARAVDMGIGLECASLGEVTLSIELGAKQVIFDSPCKSRDELRSAFMDFPKDRMYTNLDNEQEIADIAAILKENPDLDLDGKVGLRINPVTGGGAIASVSTATRGSKFGLPLVPETRERLIGLYKDNEWLQGVHIHVGSQGIPFSMLQVGARTLMGFVADVEKVCGKDKIKVIDIGGGLPTSYLENSEAYSFAEYRRALQEAVPELFSGRYRVFTEFGRCVLTKPGITASRVAVVKGAPWHPERPLATVHVGSNQFVREAYLGDVWRHRFTALGPDCEPHPGADSLQLFDIAGPMCFQGDYLAKGVPLPVSLGSGDILVMHDTGGYTLAMYSRYNSRQAGPVYGYQRDENGAGGFKFVVLKDRETLEESLAFWGPRTPPPACGEGPVAKARKVQ